MSEQFLRGEGVFEITDHTTASDWERFISGIEEVLTEFKITKQSEVDAPPKELPEGFISSGLWHEKCDTVRFGNVTFDVRYQYLDDSSIGKNSVSTSNEERNSKGDESPNSDSLDWRDAENEGHDESNELLIEEKREHSEHELPEDLPECLVDIVSTNNDFASKAHCLVRWYNFRKFIALIPRGDTIVSEDRIKLVLSSASVALANVDCHVPIFVQTHNPKNHFYQGISEHSNIRTMYEMIFMRQSLKQYQYLSDLINLFREKISCNLNDPISATIRMNYCLDFFDLFQEPHEEFSGTEYEDDQDDLVKMTLDKTKKKAPTRDLKIQDLRSGATFEQITEAMDSVLPHPYKILRFIHVAALWPPVSDKVITDSRVHSDLDPVEAPVWTMRCVTSDNCNIKIVHEIQVVNDLLQAAIRYAYEKLDAAQTFTVCDRGQLEAECLKLSYDLATKPEVVVSTSPTDSIRKLIALMFYRSSELRVDVDALEQAVAHLKKRYTLGEVYRDFKRQTPSVKEFIIRTQISRPFSPISTPALPQRMFCTIAGEEFRLCGAFSELCN